MTEQLPHFLYILKEANAKSLSINNMLSFIFISAYLIFLLVFGMITHRTKTDQDFTLAGRQMKTFPVLISILATETSAASLLLFPDLGFSVNNRFLFMQLVAGMILGRLLSAYLLIGPIYRSKKNSVYEILAEKFSARFADSGAVLYVIATVLAAGVRLFIGAIALSILLSGKNDYLQIALFILLAGGIAVYYSQKGGLRGVIYTDNFQFLWIIIALFSVLALNITNLHFADFHWNLFIRISPPENATWYGYTFSLPLALTGGIVLSLGSHGIDQTTVQRVLAQKSEAEARKSVIYSAFLIGPFVFLYLLCGFAFFNADLPYLKNQQYVYPWYLNGARISWLTALSSLAFLSASMSSIDSALHSIATSLKSSNLKFVKRVSLKQLSILSGGCLVLSALLFQYIKWKQPDALLISLALGATGMIFSPMAALYVMMYHYRDPFEFSLSPKVKRIKTQIALVALASGILCNLILFAMNNFILEVKISWLLSLLFSFLLTSGVFVAGFKAFLRNSRIKEK